MNELFQRPANYWLRHADRHKQSGDLIRAAVLQRHAVRAEPGSDAARMQYALTLRQLHCYEASNREAFCALAVHPDQAELYGLIGCNLLSMGLRREGLDALGHYMHADIAAIAPWHDEACDLAEAYDYPFEDRRRQARLDGLLKIAAHRIARGDLDGAGRALRRAQQTPYQAPDAQRELVLAVYWLHRLNAEKCAAHMQRALEMKFFDVPTLASAAALCRQMGAHRPARMLLVRAAMLAQTPSEEYLVSQTAAGMNMAFVAQGMLKRSLQRSADRCPVLYNLCVCALKLGRIQEAARYIHLCREIDPDDVPSETLFARVMDWQKQDLNPMEIRKAARSVSFYGSCSTEELAACAQPFWESVQGGPEAMAEAIRQDERLRRRLLFLLTLPLDWPVTLLRAVCACLPAAECERLLREVLMQHPADSAAKRCATSLLHRMGASAPCVNWSRDRFLLLDPGRFLAPVPTFRQRMLTRRIHETAKLCGTESIPWALEIVSSMTHAQQSRVIGDHWKVWPLAMAVRWRAVCGLPPVHVSIQTMSPLRLAALRDALRTVSHIDSM